MISYDKALETLLTRARERGQLPFQSVALRDALGRSSSGRIAATEDLPAFDNSAMDGYAVPSALTRAATEGTPVRLPVSAVLAAGDVAAAAAGGSAVEIMTGAPVPAGCDAVVRLEDVERLDGGRAIALRAPAAAGDFLRPRGGDYRSGAVVLESGTLIQPKHVLALAALGVPRVSVRWKPKVGVISTGRELVDAGSRPGPGQIRNATAPYLAAALEEMGAQVLSQNSVGDDPAEFQRRVSILLDQELDLIIATGAVSMGRHDFVPAAVEEMGAEILFHKTATRPGKPGLAAAFGNGPMFFGMPGNPLSTVVALRFFVGPVVRFMLGRPQETPLRARLCAELRKPAGLRCFFKGRLSQEPDGLGVHSLPGQASFQIQPLLEADCWLSLPEDAEVLPAGAVVEVYPL